MRFILYYLVFTCLFTSLQAQRCATYNYDQKSLPYSPGPSTHGLISAREILKDEVIVIPVVVHVLYNTPAENISDAQILSQLEVLNKDYRRLNSDTTNT